MIAAACAYAWFAAGLRPFTLPIDIAVAVCAAAVAWLALRPTPAQTGPSLPGGQVWPWAGLVGLLTALEVVNYFSSPRSDHPTLSSMADSLMSLHVERAALFLCWLLLGWALFLRQVRA